MMTTFNYGSDASLQLDLAAGALVADFTGPRELEADVAAATKAAWEAPLGFPPLRRAIVPDDRVVLALGPSVPQAPEVVAAVVAVLCEAGVIAGDILVLRSAADVEA